MNKWLIFTVVCVAILITLGVLAVDERDVIWEGRRALCPYCRAEVAVGALACRECGRSFDWVTKSEPCKWCLTRADADYLSDMFDELQLDEGPMPDALAAFPRAYFLAMEEGACTYCGGVGSVLRDGAEVECPVCHGDKRCVACGGDRLVEVGDPGAAARLRQRRAARRQAEARAELTGLPLKRSLLARRDVEALRGYVEAEELVDEQGRPLLERARRRIELAFERLRAEVDRRAVEQPADARGS